MRKLLIPKTEKGDALYETHPRASYPGVGRGGLIVELLFRLLGLVPEGRHARVVEASIQFNYTTVLNVAFLVLAAVLVWRFLKTGGPEMLKEM
jgi:hypothetical protein